MDILQVTKRSEVGNNEFDRRCAVDCFVLEKHPSLVADSSKKTRGISVKRWVNHFLGFFHYEMDQVLTGLLEGFLTGFEAIPLRKWIRATLKSLDGLKGIGFEKMD
jgi:hypothetical protein